MQSTEPEATPAPLIPFLGVTVGALAFAWLIGATTGSVDAALVIYGGYVVCAWVWIAFWMGREVQRAGNNGVVVGLLVIVFWPIGVYLWANRRPPGPVWTRVGRWIVWVLIGEGVVGMALVAFAYAWFAIRELL